MNTALYLTFGGHIVYDTPPALLARFLLLGRRKGGVRARLFKSILRCKR